MMENGNAKRLVVVGPDSPTAYSIYKITIGEFVYIGHTRDLNTRAKRHATDVRRTVGKLWSAMECDMVVEHVASACSKEEARELEQKHIKEAAWEHCQYLLNVHHASYKRYVTKLK